MRARAQDAVGQHLPRRRRRLTCPPGRGLGPPASGGRRRAGGDANVGCHARCQARPRAPLHDDVVVVVVVLCLGRTPPAQTGEAREAALVLELSSRRAHRRAACPCRMRRHGRAHGGRLETKGERRAQGTARRHPQVCSSSLPCAGSAGLAPGACLPCGPAPPGRPPPRRPTPSLARGEAASALTTSTRPTRSPPRSRPGRPLSACASCSEIFAVPAAPAHVSDPGWPRSS